MTASADMEAITDVLRAIAHDVRLTLLRTLLERGETSVGELETLTGIGQPGLSQQLAILRKAELVRTRREAKLVFYRLAPDALRDAAALLCALSGSAPNSPSGAAPAALPRADARVRGSAARFARIV